MTTTRLPRLPRLRRLATASVAVVLVAGCGSEDDSVSSPAGAAPAEPSEETTAPPTTATPTTTTEVTTAVPTTTLPATTTTEPCGTFCPLTDDQQEAVDRFFEGYNGNDWDAFLTVVGTDSPEWQVDPNTVQNAELMRYDFIWAAALNQQATPDQCSDQYGVLSCTVVIEDDLHRALAPFGFEPSRCKMSWSFDGEIATPKGFSLLACFQGYDVAMHTYGGWFDSKFPDQDPIQGFHYRAWNQTDETAGARAAEHIDQWIAEVVQPFVDEGGDIFSAT